MNPIEYSDEDFDEMISEFIWMAEQRIFTSARSAEILNALLNTNERGLRWILGMVEIDTAFNRVESILGAIRMAGIELDLQKDVFDKKIIELLLKIVFEEAVLDKRRLALILLGEILAWVFPEDKMHINSQIVGLLFDENPRLRYEVIEYAKNHHLDEAIPYLALLLDDPDPEIIYLSLKALKHFVSPSAKLVLEEWEKRQ